ncbi:MAG TPA: hypothetical protein VG820_05005 [Fimbriimonadaceae bacterium]|nr:hypothetical protein [Fimbriimonadaceae bacterium]
MSTPAQETSKGFPCHQCGAKLNYAPGTTSLKCEYCGFVNEIPQSADQIEELDFNQYLEIARQESVPDTQQTLKCSACAAEFTASGAAVSDSCPFCGSNVLVPQPAEVRIKPKSLLPFKLTIEQARECYRKWITTRWLAPNALKKFAREEGKLQGIYVPYWTYDCDTTTAYTGERGDAYYRTETYTDSDGNTQTREVREIQWWPVSGVVFDQFDDLLVPASNSVPEQHARALKNWDLPDLVGYQEAYLSGFRTERYRKGLEEGFDDAKGLMEPTIDRSIRWDIGGDEQRIFTKATQYDSITFKHILLPIYLGAYRFRDKAYSYLVNARTGEIHGDAPISFWKVLGLVILGLLIIGGILYLKSKGHR